MEEDTVTISEFRLEDIPESCTWIVVGNPGSGKCLAPGTPLLMFDGSVKIVEDVKPGDKLMGDDFKQRNVLSVCEGYDDMYKIKQHPYGIDYIVNKDHILVLKDISKDEIIEKSVETILFEADDISSAMDNYKGIRIKTSYDNSYEYNISISSVGKGKYYGFQIDRNGRFLLSDGTVTHNTTLIENMAYYRKHIYPVARCFVGTESGYQKFCEIFGELYVSNYYDEEHEKMHILRQRTCALENGDKHASNYAINILDDVSDDPRIFKTKVMNALFKLGSQHYHQLLIIGTQYAIDFPPPIRKATSYVALFREPEPVERHKLWLNFGGIAGTEERFNALMDQLTGDYTCLIIKKRSQSQNLEDCIFYYKTQVIKPWKFGCDEYKEWQKNRYDKNYTEKLI